MRSSSFDCFSSYFHSMAIRLFKLVREINTLELVSIYFRYFLFLCYSIRFEMRLNSPLIGKKAKIYIDLFDF